MDEKTRANREVWNAVAESHFRSYDVERLLAGEPLLNEVIRREVGEVGGKSLIHLLCHLGTDTLSWALLGAQVTGVDIAPQAIRLARRLARQMGVRVKFIVSDVLDVPGKIKTTYDIVFASTGVLCWLSDIDQFAGVVHGLLKPGGFVYLFDGHPFRNMLTTNTAGENLVTNDYFRKVAWEYDEFTDCVEKDLVIPQKTYEWDWTLGEIVTAFCRQKLRIAFLHEYPEYFYGGYVPTDVANHQRELYPCTFSLKAVAE